MNHQDLVVPPLSRADIRKKARTFRQVFQLDNQLYFPIVEIMELMNSMPDVFHDFNMEVLEESEMKNFHGLTLPNGTIKIRNDVYIRAGKGIGTDRDTMAHELGHWLLHRNNRAHARLGSGRVPTYCTPEWQAKAFSGELLVFSVKQISPFSSSEFPIVIVGKSPLSAGLVRRQVPLLHPAA